MLLPHGYIDVIQFRLGMLNHQSQNQTLRYLFCFIAPCREGRMDAARFRQHKAAEAHHLTQSACALLRQHPRAGTAPPEVLANLLATLRDLLTCIAILLSLESIRAAESDIYTILAGTLQQVVDNHAAPSAVAAEEFQRDASPAQTSTAAPLIPAAPSSQSEAASSSPSEPLIQPLHTTLRWADIHGCEEAITALQQATLLPKRFPQFFTGVRRPWRRLLLFGPPGTGKTLLASATAGELDVPFLSVSAADLLSKWVGETEKHVRRAFQQAAAYTSCVFFLDEIDGLCSTRGVHGETEVARRLKTEFLLHLQALPPSVLLMAATNLPWEMDSAIRRRFERFVYVGLPDDVARRSLIASQLEGIDHKLSTEDIGWVVRATRHYSASDVVQVMSHAMAAPMQRLTKATALRIATYEDLVQHGRLAARPAVTFQKGRAPLVGHPNPLTASLSTEGAASDGSSASRSPTAAAFISPTRHRLNRVVLKRKRSPPSEPRASSCRRRSESAVSSQSALPLEEENMLTYYVPCEGNHPGALPWLRPSQPPAGRLLLPQVCMGDVQEACRLFVPSVSQAELDRFHQWRLQGTRT